MKSIFLALNLLIGIQIAGATEIYESLKILKNPTIQNARKVVAALEPLERSADDNAKKIASFIRVTFLRMKIYHGVFDFESDDDIKV